MDRLDTLARFGYIPVAATRGEGEKRKNRRKRDTVGYRLRFDGVKTSLKLNVFCETRPVTDHRPRRGFPI